MRKGHQSYHEDPGLREPIPGAQRQDVTSSKLRVLKINCGKVLKGGGLEGTAHWARSGESCSRPGFSVHLLGGK